MRDFVNRVSQKLSKLPPEQVEQVLDALTDENETLDAILESLATGLLICDEDWHLLHRNKAVERYLTLSLRTIKTDEPVWESIADEKIAEFLKSTAENKKNNVSNDFTVETPSGANRIISISTLPLVHKFKMIGSIIQIEDITEKRNQEILLRRMENLSSLTNLAASVAHEIKNPLGSISIHIQLIQKTLKKARETDALLPDEKFLEKYLGIVNEEIDRLNKIIVDFLFAVRPVSASLEPIVLKPLLEKFYDFVLPELEKNKITLEQEINSDVSAMIDEKLFKQVLINLVQNAIAAMPKGGKIWLNLVTKNDKILLTIADNGIGMDEKTLSRIFEPYFTTKTTGTGLGLTMVYKIIREFGGNIEVKSFPGEGSVFVITLPQIQKQMRTLEYHEI